MRKFTTEPRTRAEIFEWLEREHGIASDGTNRVWYALRLEAKIAHAPEACLWRAPIHRPSFVAVEHEQIEGKAAPRSSSGATSQPSGPRRGRRSPAGRG